MKKANCIISGIIFIALMISGMAWALEISPADISGKPGDTVVVPINISNVGTGLDIDAFSFTIQFSSGILTFDETSGIDKTGTLAEKFSLVSGKILEPGKVKINGALFENPVHISSSGLFLKIKFTVISEGASELRLSDFLNDIKTATTTDATITVSSAESLEPPANLEARSGIDSVRLSWQPVASAYLAGYNVYRSISSGSGYTQINDMPVTGDFYTDSSNLTNGVTYYYQMTAEDVSGNESDHSATAYTVFGHVKFFIPDSFGGKGMKIRVPVNISNADGLDMCSVDIRVIYDPKVLSAVSVESTALSTDYHWDYNADESGIVRALISAPEAETLYGEGSLFYILFDVIGNQGDTSELKFDSSQTAFFDCDDLYNPVSIDLTDIGLFTVTDGGYILGDLDGDRDVDDTDAGIDSKIAVGKRIPTQREMYVGDVSGDRRIMSNDVALILRIWKKMPLTPISSVNTRVIFRESSVNISIPSNIRIHPGGSIWIPIEISNAENVAGADIVLNYDSAVITATDARSTLMTNNFKVEFNADQNGQIKISLTEKDGKELNAESGAMVEIKFAAKSDTPINTVSPLILAIAHLNDAYSRDFAASALKRDVKTVNGSITADYPLGDVDHSGTVNLYDAVLALKALTGINENGIYTDTEVGNNGKIGLEDVVYILQRIADMR